MTSSKGAGADVGMERSARLELVYRIVSAVSHDFNNVLATASMYSELLLQDPAVEGAVAEDVREILDAARRGAALTAFLAVVKDSRGASAEPADVAVQLGHLEKILGRLLPEQVDVAVEVPAAPAIVRIDRVGLQQAIFAVVWAIGEAMAKSGGEIRISADGGERGVAVEVRGTPAGSSSGSRDAGGAGDDRDRVRSGGLAPEASDPVIRETRKLLERFGGGLEVEEGEGFPHRCRLLLPREGADAQAGPDDEPTNREPRAVIVGDTALGRLVRSRDVRVTEVSTLEEAESELGHDRAPEALVATASPAAFALVRSLRSAKTDTFVILVAASVDAGLPPDLDRDRHVCLLRAPVVTTHLVELIRGGVGAGG